MITVDGCHQHLLTSASHRVVCCSLAAENMLKPDQQLICIFFCLVFSSADLSVSILHMLPFILPRLRPLVINDKALQGAGRRSGHW